MTSEDIVECYCGDDEDDGTMLFCELCKKWQHAVCVNWNSFTAPTHYTCPTCSKIVIRCVCRTEGDYQHAIVQCSKCHNYQHKRHVGFGIGINPPCYVCTNCQSYCSAGRKIKIEPILSFFPSFNEKLVPLDISKCPIQFPQGKLLNKLKEYNSPISPVHLATSVFGHFRDIIFKSHHTLQYFDFTEYDPKANVEDCCQFMYYLTHAISFMANITIPQVMQIFDHAACLTIYKRAMPLSFRCPVGSNPVDFRVHSSDRAEDVVKAKIKPKYMRYPEEVPVLNAVAGRNAFPTIVSTTDFSEGAFICGCYGYLMDLEEIDHIEKVPEFALFNVANSNLYLDASRVQNSAAFLHIRRGLMSNCEVRLFRSSPKGTKKKALAAGIFATKPVLMQRLISTVSGTSEAIAIKAGEELILPFDIGPIYIKPDAEWRTTSSSPSNDNNNYVSENDESISDQTGNLLEIDYEIFMPETPSQKLQGVIDPDIEVVKESELKYSGFGKKETTLRSLFGNSSILNFSLEEPKRQGKKKNKKKGDKKGEESEFQKQQDLFQQQLREARKVTMVLHDDPLKSKKSWCQKWGHSSKIPEFEIGFRNKWNAIPMPKPVTKEDPTPAEYCKCNHENFVDVTDADLT